MSVSHYDSDRRWSAGRWGSELYRTEDNNPRTLAIEALPQISRERPHPEELWLEITQAEDSLLLERPDAQIGALQAFYIRQAKIRPIPDSAFALILSTAVEQALELAIETHSEGTTRDWAAISNKPFYTKINTGHRSGIYPQSAKDELDMIRLIRNAFAHSWTQLTFLSEAISEGCAALWIPDRFPWDNKPRIPTAKERFWFSARNLFVYLEWRSPGPMRFESHPLRNKFQS